MVFAIILFIIFFSAIVLYLAYRIKETFRAETRRGITITKIVFLIGILFLAGGSFYFFANTVATSNSDPSSEPPVDSSEPPVDDDKAHLTLVINYPTTIRTNTNLIISFTLSNPTSYTAHDVLIQLSGLLESFTQLSSTHEVSGNLISIGEVSSGTTICSLELNSPDRPLTLSDIIIVSYLEMTDPLTQPISISVIGGRS